MHGVFIRLGDYTEYMDSVCPAFITIPYEACNQSNGIERIERELGHRMRCAFDPDFRAWLAAHGHIESEDNVVEESTTQAEDSHIELSVEDIGKITDPIVMSNIGGYSFCIYLPANICRDAPAANEAIDTALREHGFDPNEIKRGKQKKEYKYDGAFFYLYRDNPRMQIIPLYTDSKPLWRRAEMFRNAFSAQFHKWLTAHGMAA